MNWYQKSTIKKADNWSGEYYYRVHPKGDISSALRNGLWSYSPGEGPGSYVDHPEFERWPGQDIDDQQTYRFYVADSEWEIGFDRFRIRIPVEFVENLLVEDELGDYYIDTGSESRQILEPNQFEIDIGKGRWVRADMLTDKTMPRVWERMYKKPPGYFGNKWNSDWGELEEYEEEEEWEE